MGTVPFEEEQKDKDRRHAHHPLFSTTFICLRQSVGLAGEA